MNIKTREELSNELTQKQSELAVAEAKIKELSESLGVEPNLDAVVAEIQETQQKIKECETRAESVLVELEELQKEYEAVKAQKIEVEDSTVNVAEEATQDNDDFAS